MSVRRLDQRGVTAVEYAILAPVLLTLVLCTIEIGFQATIAFALDYSARMAGRLGVAGTAGTNGVIADFTTREAALRSTVLTASGNLLKDPQLTFSQTSYTNIADAAANTNGTSGGGSGANYVRYVLRYTQPLLTDSVAGGLVSALLGRTSFTYISTILVTNEQF